MKNFITVFFSILTLIFSGAAFCENLYKGRSYRGTSNAASDILTIYAAEGGYKAINFRYATLEELTSSEQPFLPRDFAGGEKDGYIFQITIDNRHDTFYITAEPRDLMEKYSFYVDERGILCKSYKVNTPVPLRHATALCPPHFKETNLQTELLSKE
jgi:hypothetical protein